MMKNFLRILVLGLLLSGCSTTSSVVSGDTLKINMSKYELNEKFFMLYPGDDPFVYGGGSELYSDINKEIIWGANKNQFYVFRGVSEPVNCGIIMCNKIGNGTLESWHNTLESARASISKTISETTSTTSETTSTKKVSKGGKEKMAEEIKKIPGVADAGWPQDISLWIFMTEPKAKHDFDRLGYSVCNGGVTKFGVPKGYSITFWNPYNKKEIGKFRCY